MSGLSLSQVSCISFFALPIVAEDLSNSDQYVFGEEGAAKVVRLDEDTSRRHRRNRLRSYDSRSKLTEPVSVENLRLKGRFARKGYFGRIEPKASDDEVQAIQAVQDGTSAAEQDHVEPSEKDSVLL